MCAHAVIALRSGNAITDEERQARYREGDGSP
jgi:hypothetical protein